LGAPKNEFLANASRFSITDALSDQLDKAPAEGLQSKLCKQVNNIPKIDYY
jgi:hypothetical protein